MMRMFDDDPPQTVESLKADNARLRRLLERQGSSAGLRHQVRNTVAMVRDLVRQSAEYFEGVEDYAGHLDARLDAVFRIQNTITNCLPDGVPLDLIVTDELLAFALSEGERLSVSGPDVSLQPAAAGAVALAVHELATNAVKFGALSTSAGRIAVSWTTDSAPDAELWLMLDWRESGVPEGPTRPARRGFGTEVIESALRYQLGGEGTLAFAPGGLCCNIRLPLKPWIGAPGRHRRDPLDAG